VKLSLAGGGSDGVGSLVEGVLDFAAQQGQNGDNNQGDQGDQQAVFNEGLAFFFLEKTIDHDGTFLLSQRFASFATTALAENLSNTLLAI
jgi:hypothetical protein